MVIILTHNRISVDEVSALAICVTSSKKTTFITKYIIYLVMNTSINFYQVYMVSTPIENLLKKIKNKLYQPQAALMFICNVGGLMQTF